MDCSIWIKVVLFRDGSTFILSAERVARWNDVTVHKVQFDFEGRCRARELVGTSADLLQDLPERNRSILKQSQFAREKQVHSQTVNESVNANFQEAVGVPVHQVVSFADAFISDKSLERKLVAEVG